MITQDSDALGSTEVAVSVAVLVDAIDDVTGSIEVCYVCYSIINIHDNNIANR